jgi:hypothetical protein
LSKLFNQILAEETEALKLLRRNWFLFNKQKHEKPQNFNTDFPTVRMPVTTRNLRTGRQAGMIGFITLQQSAPSQMTWQYSNAFRKH